MGERIARGTASADSPGAIPIGKNHMILNMGPEDHTKMFKKPWVFKTRGAFRLVKTMVDGKRYLGTRSVDRCVRL